MKEDFLTIPDAPDYEINSRHVVRNKQTGRIVTPVKSSKTVPYYWLKSTVVPLGIIHRTAVALRRQAVVAVKHDTFMPIPSIGGKYEIDQVGNVRNARTKKRIKLKKKHNIYNMWGNNYKRVGASRNSLLWEVHGKYKKGCRPVGVWAESATTKRFFPSCAACARFLSEKLHHLTKNTIRTYLWARKPSFADWKFTYVEQLGADIPWDWKGLNALARRNKKLASS